MAVVQFDELRVEIFCRTSSGQEQQRGKIGLAEGNKRSVQRDSAICRVDLDFGIVDCGRSNGLDLGDERLIGRRNGLELLLIPAAHADEWDLKQLALVLVALVLLARVDVGVGDALHGIVHWRLDPTLKFRRQKNMKHLVVLPAQQAHAGKQ